EVLQFSNDYLLELLGRFINWDLVGAGFIALVVYLLLSQWLRMTFFTMLAITVLSLMHWSDIWLPQGARLFVQNTWAGLTTQALNLPPADTLPQTTVAAHQDSVPVPATSPQPAATKPVSLNSLLDEELALFYEE